MRRVTFSLTIIVVILASIAVLAASWEPKTTTVSASFVTVCQEDVGPFPNVSFKIHNTGANPLTDCKIETWVGPLATDWTTYIAWTSCASLAAGSSTILEVAGNSQEKLRVQAKSTVGTTVYCRPYGNNR